MFVGEYSLGNAEATEENIVQFPEKNMGTVMNEQGKLVQSVYNLQSDLIAGGINKSVYILYMLRLLYGCNKDLEVTPENLITILDCSGVTPLGKEKEIKFDVQDVQVELAKLSKKGLLEINEVPIQLRIQGL
ncbi:MAG: Planktothrix phage PaV-LD [Pseudomonadota bacterium]|jgi:hypothetical protein